MLKILLALFLPILILIITPCWAITNQWRGGVGTQELDGTQASSLIGYNSYNHIVQPLDNLLATYCNEYLIYGSSSTIKVSSGSCMVSNSQGTIRLTLIDTAVSTLTSSNLDTGSLTSSTTYYVYSTAATNASTSSTYYISASNTAPSGQTYYYQIGSFTTDGSTNISGLVNNMGSTSFVGTASSKSGNVTYQALTDGTVEGSAYVQGGVGGSQSGTVTFYTGSNSSVSTSSVKTVTIYLFQASGQTNGGKMPFNFTVRKGDYYEMALGTNGSIDSMYFTPTSK